MKTDIMTKILLALIALGLLMNAFNPWLRPVVRAEAAQNLTGRDLEEVESHLERIANAIQAVARGTCGNDNLC